MAERRAARERERDQSAQLRHARLAEREAAERELEENAALRCRSGWLRHLDFLSMRATKE